MNTKYIKEISDLSVSYTNYTPINDDENEIKTVNGRNYQLVGTAVKNYSLPERVWLCIRALAKMVCFLNIAEKEKSSQDWASFWSGTRVKQIYKQCSSLPSQLTGQSVAGLPPPGFPINQYGNNCWFNADLQALFAHPDFEKIITQPIQKRMIYTMPLVGLNVETRAESEEEFEKRKKIQQALIALVEARKTYAPEKILDALDFLHSTLVETCLYSQWILPRGKGSGIGGHTISAVLDALDYGFSIAQIDRQTLSDEDLTLDHSSGNLLVNASWAIRLLHLIKSKQMIPELIHIRSVYLQSPKLDAIFDFSTCMDSDLLKGKKALYEVAGCVDWKGHHLFSYAKKGKTWFCCDDGRVKKLSQTPIPHSAQCFILKTHLTHRLAEAK